MNNFLPAILRRLRLIVTIVVGLLLCVWPFAEAMLTATDQIMFCVGAAVTVGVGTGLRLGRNAGVGLGLGVGAVIGVASAIVLYFLREHQGPAEIIPPIVGLGIGFIDGIGAEKLKGRYQPVAVSLIIGGLIGFGTIALIGWEGFVASCIAGIFVGTAASIRRSPEGRWRDGLILPPAPMLALNLVLTISAAILLIRDDASVFSSWWMIAPAVLFVVLYPVLSFVIGRALALWLRPRIQVYRDLICYLQVMWVSLGAFALGYVIIILIFAGFYGTLHKYATVAPFTGVDGPTMLDWVFFSFLTATTMGSENVIPVTRPAQLLVGMEAVAGLAWIIIMFAAVMSYLQPRFEAMARRTVECEDETTEATEDS